MYLRYYYTLMLLGSQTEDSCYVLYLSKRSERQEAGCPWESLGKRSCLQAVRRVWTYWGNNPGSQKQTFACTLHELTCQVKKNPAPLFICLTNKHILLWILGNRIKWEGTHTQVIAGDENILCLPSFHRPWSSANISYKPQLPLYLTPDPLKTIRNKNIILFVCTKSTGPQAKSWYKLAFSLNFCQGTQNIYYSVSYVSTKPEKRSSRRLERGTWECMRSFLL